MSALTILSSHTWKSHSPAQSACVLDGFSLALFSRLPHATTSSMIYANQTQLLLLDLCSTQPKPQSHIPPIQFFILSPKADASVTSTTCQALTKDHIFKEESVSGPDLEKLKVGANRHIIKNNVENSLFCPYSSLY